MRTRQHSIGPLLASRPCRGGSSPAKKVHMMKQRAVVPEDLERLCDFFATCDLITCDDLELNETELTLLIQIEGGIEPCLRRLEKLESKGSTFATVEEVIHSETQVKREKHRLLSYTARNFIELIRQELAELQGEVGAKDAEID